MKWIGQHIWDLTSRFRNDIYFEGLAETDETRGLVVDANGKVSINPLSGDEHATHVYENVRNDEGATIPVGTPVYSKGEIGGSERIKVGIADASDPTKMPAIGITNTELTTTGDTRDGLITLVGVYNTNISGFTGLSENDIVYVASGGGLTITKPTGVNLIQNVGIILKTNGTIIQGLAVTCIGRTNDVPTPLYIDHANQRVGIGATSPSEKLEVDGNINASGGIQVGFGTFSGTSDTVTDAAIVIPEDKAIYTLDGGQYLRNLIRKDSDVIKIGQPGTALVDEIRFLPGTLGFTSFYGDATEVARITSSGNVGIGQTDPQTMLHLTTAMSSSPTTKLYLDVDGNNIDGGGAEIIFNASASSGTPTAYNAKISGTRASSAAGSSQLGFWTTEASINAAPQERMRIDKDGNVGIGTTSPNVPLEVNGNTRFGNSATGIAFGISSTDVYQISGADVGFAGWNSLHFKADGNDGLFIEKDTNNVGIGTTSPDSELHVYKEGNAFIKVDSGATSPYIAGVEFLRSSVNGGRIYNDGSAVQVKLESYYGYESANPTRGGFTFKTAPVTSGTLVDALRINALGNVGIGTSSPTHKLEVRDGDVHFENTSSSNTFLDVKGSSANAYIRAYSDSNSVWLYQGGSSSYLQAQSGSTLRLGSGTANVVITDTSGEVMRTSSGNVGIGTTSPGYKFVVNSSTADTVAKFESTDAIARLELKDDDDAAYVGTQNNKAFIGMEANATGTNNLIVTSDGKVGIGTSSPSARLEVTGNAVITGDLTVQGTTVTLDTTNLNVEDKNITLNYSTGDSSGSADGAGITIQDAVDASNDATMLWNASSDRFDFSHPITAKDSIRFVTSGGTDGGLIDMDSNDDLVISNPLGGIFLGNGTDDIYIGDGTSSVDIRFEQNMAIYADSSTTRTLTIGGANTNLILDSPSFSGTVTLGATSINNKLTFTTSNGYINFDFEPSGETGEYSTPTKLLTVSNGSSEEVIMQRLSQSGALMIGHDDIVAIAAGDTWSILRDNIGWTGENVILASEAGFTSYAFPNNDTTWSNRNTFRFYGGSATAAENGLYIGDGSNTQFIDLDRNLKNIGTITANSNVDVHGTLRAHGGSLLIEDTDSDDIHGQINSNSTEGVLRLRNGANWGLIARGIGNSPRLGAYHNGDLRIYGFGAADGADHADDDELARFDFANERLQVNGEIRASGNITTTGNSYIVSSRKFTARDGNGTGLFADDAASGLSIADDGDATFTGKVQFTSSDDYIDVISGDLYIVAGSGKKNILYSNNLESLRLDESQNATFAGDVKADTHFTSSDTNVTLSTSSNGTVFLRPNGKSSTTAQSTFTNALASIGTNATFTGDVTIGPKNNATVQVSESGGATVKMLAGSVGRIGTYSDHNFIITQNSNDAITIDTSRNVGIGTSSPDHKFHVEFTNGDTSFSGGSLGDWGSDGIRIENTSGTVDTMAMLQFRNADADIHIAGIRQGTNDSDLGFFFEGSEKVRITSAGNVGIGTTSPAYKLDVNGGGVKTTTATGNRIAYYDGSGINAYGGTSGYAISNYTGDLNIRQHTNDGDIIFQCDDGSGDIETYFFLDGSNGLTTFPDNKKLTFGNASDLRIFHDGSHSYIRDSGTGNLRIDASNFYVRNSGGTKIAIDALDGAEVALRYDGSRKLETTSTGVEVNGKIKATDINFSGLPTSSVGLSAGDVWDDNGTLKIVR